MNNFIKTTGLNEWYREDTLDLIEVIYTSAHGLYE